MKISDKKVYKGIIILVKMSLVNKIKDYFAVSIIQQELALSNGTLAIILASKSNNSLIESMLLGGVTFASILNETLAIRQYALMNRLEKSIEKHGYDSRLTKPFMETYCGRKIVKRVLERNNL